MLSSGSPLEVTTNYKLLYYITYLNNYRKFSLSFNLNKIDENLFSFSNNN